MLKKKILFSKSESKYLIKLWLVYIIIKLYTYKRQTLLLLPIHKYKYLQNNQPEIPPSKFFVPIFMDSGFDCIP